MKVPLNSLDYMADCTLGFYKQDQWVESYLTAFQKVPHEITRALLGVFGQGMGYPVEK